MTSQVWNEWVSASQRNKYVTDYPLVHEGLPFAKNLHVSSTLLWLTYPVDEKGGELNTSSILARKRRSMKDATFVCSHGK